MQRVVVTGSSRGLGLEFVRQLLQQKAQVFATCRKPDQAATLQFLFRGSPERLRIFELDVREEENIQAVAQEISKISDGIDLLINNAGVFPSGERVDNLDPRIMLEAFRVNAVAPLIVVKHFLPLLEKGKHPRVVNITSQLGSLTLKQSGGWYSYCASKAALNMLTRTLAFDLRPKGITTVMLHPGWVKTDMGGPQAPLTPSESVAGMLKVIDRLNLNDAGKFLTWEGKEHPW